MPVQISQRSALRSTRQVQRSVVGMGEVRDFILGIDPTRPLLSSACSNRPPSGNGAPGLGKPFVLLRASPGVERLASGPASQTTSKASRPFAADRRLSATTATPVLDLHNRSDAGYGFGLRGVQKLFTLPPNTGGRATKAVNEPGSSRPVRKAPSPSPSQGYRCAASACR